MRSAINGILLLNKSTDMTSNSALQKVKRLFNAKKAGHTGSLDPIATGMLPICFGEATKFSQFLLDANKSYQVIAKLGVQTTTGDTEGEVVATYPLIDITQHRIEAVMKNWLGDIDQIPPMYSAIKYQGDPLYKLARRGIEVERQPRRIKIFSLAFDALTEDQFAFHVHCSKGTYIRTLVEDMTRELGCGGHVMGLHRSSVSPYQDMTMYTLSELESIAEKKGPEGLAACLLPVETAVKHFPAIKLSTAAIFYLKTGQAVRANFPLASSLVQLLSDDGKFLGMGEAMTDGRVKPHRLIA